MMAQVSTKVSRVDSEITMVTFVVTNSSATKQYRVEIKAEEYVHAELVVGEMCTEKLNMLVAHEDVGSFRADVQEIVVVEAPKPPTRFARMRAMFKFKL